MCWNTMYCNGSVEVAVIIIYFLCMATLLIFCLLILYNDFNVFF